MVFEVLRIFHNFHRPSCIFIVFILLIFPSFSPLSFSLYVFIALQVFFSSAFLLTQEQSLSNSALAFWSQTASIQSLNTKLKLHPRLQRTFPSYFAGHVLWCRTPFRCHLFFPIFGKEIKKNYYFLIVWRRPGPIELWNFKIMFTLWFHFYKLQYVLHNNLWIHKHSSWGDHLPKLLFHCQNYLRQPPLRTRFATVLVWQRAVNRQPSFRSPTCGVGARSLFSENKKQQKYFLSKESQKCHLHKNFNQIEL